MTSPATLSLADLAAAVVRLGAHRDATTGIISTGDNRAILGISAVGDHTDLLLAAANRLPAVVADFIDLTGRNDAIDASRSEWRMMAQSEQDTALRLRVANNIAATENAALRAECERLRLAVAELRAVLEVVQNLDENDGIARGKLYREDAPTLFEPKDDGFGALYLGHAIERVMRKTKETP